MQEYRETGIQGNRNTGIQRCRNTGIQGNRNTGTQRCRNTGIQGCRDDTILISFTDTVSQQYWYDCWDT